MSGCGTGGRLRAIHRIFRIRSARSAVILGTALAVTVSACGHPPRHTPIAAAPSISVRWIDFVATAYCHGAVTATGAPIARGVVAADPSVLPLGTMIRISGAPPYDREYRVLDTGPKVRGRHVDLYMADCGEARRFGRRTVRVTVVTQAGVR
jgi:3D (Asp-Asp-Asp) domain-containing protein